MGTLTHQASHDLLSIMLCLSIPHRRPSHLGLRHTLMDGPTIPPVCNPHTRGMCRSSQIYVARTFDRRPGTGLALKLVRLSHQMGD